MINFKDRQDMLPSLVSVASIIALAGTLVFGLWANAHPVNPVPAIRQAERDLTDAGKKIDKARTRISLDQTTIDTNTWTGAAQDIQTQVLNRLSAIAAKRGVKINTVRPQRAANVDEVATLPYLVTVDGSYTAVLAFERDIEEPSNKLAVSSIQITSTDPNSDHVTGSVGVVAYLNPKGQPSIDSKENKTNA